MLQGFLQPDVFYKLEKRVEDESLRLFFSAHAKGTVLFSVIARGLACVSLEAVRKVIVVGNPDRQRDFAYQHIGLFQQKFAPVHAHGPDVF